MWHFLRHIDVKSDSPSWSPKSMVSYYDNNGKHYQDSKYKGNKEEEEAYQQTPQSPPETIAKKLPVAIEVV